MQTNFDARIVSIMLSSNEHQRKCLGNELFQLLSQSKEKVLTIHVGIVAYHQLSPFMRIRKKHYNLMHGINLEIKIRNRTKDNVEHSPWPSMAFLFSI